MNVETIKNPKFIKNLTNEDMVELSQDIRNFLIEKVSKTGGHLASNLGIVEITLALHYVFDSYKDKFLFDVGHQSYVHKILTGRADKFDSLRQFGGISGFQKRRESIHDHFESGHSSTSLSTAIGMATARDLNNEDYNVIPIIGDGSLMSGLSFEALNQIGHSNTKVIIVLNDNGMSINPNVNVLSKAFSSFCSSDYYNGFKNIVKKYIKKNKNGEEVITSIHNLKKAIKNFIVDPSFFDDFNIEYFGPIDGHDINSLIKTFKLAKENKRSCVIHCVTTKGKGYKYSEEDQIGLWHGVPPFDIKTGEFKNKNKELTSYSEIVSKTVYKLMKQNKDIVCVSPAMVTGSKLNNIFNDFKDRSFDTGITEDHSLLFASGLALAGKHPFVSIYSSFLQRAYDQVNHDIARMNLPIVVGIDRAGIVGEDGETHQGVFDISFLSSIPNICLAQAKDSKELQNLIYTAFTTNKPFFIRYPRKSVKFNELKKFNEIKLGKWEIICNKDSDACIISYGDNVCKIDEYIKKNKLNINLINARFLKPLDEQMLKNISKKYKKVFVISDDMRSGGLEDSIAQYLRDLDSKITIKGYGIDDEFVEQGNIDLLKKNLHIDIDYCMRDIKRRINVKKSKH